MRKRDRHAVKRHFVQTALATMLGSKRAMAVTAIAGTVLVSGAAYGALYGGGPAEAWTIAMISALTSAVVAQLAAFQALFMAQSQLRFEQLISAVAVATKQEGVSANQVVDATRNAGQTLVNAVRAQRVNDATVKAYLDYSPTTGQGYDACGTIVRNRTLDKAFDDAPASARKLVSQLDAAPVAVPQRFSKQQLALARVIGPRRVEVVDALVDGSANLADRPRLIDGSVFEWQPHAAEAQNRHRLAGFAQYALLHGLSFPKME